MVVAGVVGMGGRRGGAGGGGFSSGRGGGKRGRGGRRGGCGGGKGVCWRSGTGTTAGEGPLLEPCFFGNTKGGVPSPAGPTQLSRVTTNAGGRRLSLTDEGRLPPFLRIFIGTVPL